MKTSAPKLLARAVAATVVPVAISVAAASLLVVLAPGFGIDENSMDPRFASAPQTAAPSPIAACYTYAAALLRGELGTSSGFGVPVMDLLKERSGVTVRNVGVGLGGAWVLAMGLSVLGLFPIGRKMRPILTTSSGVLLCVPSALIALAAVLLKAGAAAAVIFVVFPRLHRYCDNLLQNAAGKPHVTAARARGVRMGRVVLAHVLPSVMPETIALAAVSINLGLGAAIPMEVLSVEAGVGQLAWRAALSRDLPLVAGATLWISLITIAANRAAGTVSTLTRRSA